MDSDSEEFSSSEFTAKKSDDTDAHRAHDKDDSQGKNVRRFTETVQLRSALDEVPRKPPVVSSNVSNLLPVAAAAALVIIGGLVTILVNDDGTGDQVAGATLLNEGSGIEVDSTATAALLKDGDLYRLRINFNDDLRELLTEDGEFSPGSEYLAVWLTDPSRQQVIPLGVVHGDTVIPVPTEINTVDFGVVDVSIEPTDGDPGHSGRTVLRGVLEDS